MRYVMETEAPHEAEKALLAGEIWRSGISGFPISAEGLKNFLEKNVMKLSPQLFTREILIELAGLTLNAVWGMDSAQDKKEVML